MEQNILQLYYLFFLNSRYFKKIFYLILEKGEGREKERERNIDRLPLARALTWGQACNPDMCPDLELNWWPFAGWDDAQPTEPQQSGLYYLNLNELKIKCHLH